MNTCIVLLISIVLIASMLIFKIPLWIIFTLTSFVVLILSNQIQNINETLYSLISDSSTWDLVTIMFLIALFVNLYRKTGFVNKLGEELVLLLKKPRLTTMITPAIIGLLPVPGGALMSAPIVDSIGDKIGLSNTRKLYVNVWFRHVIFLVYPISNVLVLTSILTNQNLWSIIYRQIPVALVMVLIGLFMGFRLKTINNNDYMGLRKCNSSSLFKVFTPLLLSIVLAVTLSPLLDNKPYVVLKRLSMVISVSIGIVLLSILSKTNLSTILSISRSREVVELVLIGFTSMFLKTVYSGLDFKCMYNYVSTLNPLTIVIAIPAFFSIIGGVPTSGVALSIPIITSFIEIDLEYASLIYISAFLGYLASPLHLCYVYSAQYYKVPITKGYKYLIPSILSTLFITIALYRIL